MDIDGDLFYDCSEAVSGLDGVLLNLQTTPATLRQQLWLDGSQDAN